MKLLSLITALAATASAATIGREQGGIPKILDYAPEVRPNTSPSPFSLHPFHSPFQHPRPYPLPRKQTNIRTTPQGMGICNATTQQCTIWAFESDKGFHKEYKLQCKNVISWGFSHKCKADGDWCRHGYLFKRTAKCKDVSAPPMPWPAAQGLLPLEQVDAY